MFQIILKDNTLETDSGVLTKGDVLETVHYDEIADVKYYIRRKYTDEGIGVRYRRVG